MTEKQEEPQIRMIEYNPIEKAIADLRTEYVGKVYDVETVKGLAAVRADRLRVRKTRTSLEKLRKALKAESLARGRRIDTEAKRLTKVLKEIEAPLDEIVKAEENRKAEAKAERERKAQEERDRQEAERLAEQEARDKAAAEEAERIRIEREALEKEKAEFARLKEAESKPAPPIEMMPEDGPQEPQEAPTVVHEQGSGDGEEESQDPGEPPQGPAAGEQERALAAAKDLGRPVAARPAPAKEFAEVEGYMAMREGDGGSNWLDIATGSISAEGANVRGEALAAVHPGPWTVVRVRVVEIS